MDAFITPLLTVVYPPSCANLKGDSNGRYKTINDVFSNHNIRFEYNGLY